LDSPASLGNSILDVRQGMLPLKFSPRRAMILALLAGCMAAHAQTFGFEYQSYPNSPVAFVNRAVNMVRIGSDRRLFVTIRNQAEKAAIGVVFQEALPNGLGAEIVSLERVSILIRPRETKRLSISIVDVWNRLQAAGKTREPASKPVLSVVTVEFSDGTLWNVPSAR